MKSNDVNVKMTKEPFIAHSEITDEIYIVCGREKYTVTEQVIKAMQDTDRLKQSSTNVVERSKIDNALEQTYKVREMVLHSNRTYEVNDVLDIIDEISAYFERHIGE